MEKANYSLKEAIAHCEDMRAMNMLYPDRNNDKQPWTEKDYKKAEEVLKKMGVSQEVIDELNKPW